MEMHLDPGAADFISSEDLSSKTFRASSIAGPFCLYVLDMFVWF